MGLAFTFDDAPLLEIPGLQMKVEPGEALQIANNAIADCMRRSCKERSLPPQYERREEIDKVLAATHDLWRAEGGAELRTYIRSPIAYETERYIQILGRERQRASAYDNHKGDLSHSIAKWLPLFLCDAFRRIYGDDALANTKQSEIAAWMWRMGTRAFKNCKAHPDRLTCLPGSEQATLHALEAAVGVNLTTVTDRVRRAMKCLREWGEIEGMFADPRDIPVDWAGDRNPTPAGKVKLQHTSAADARVLSRCITEAVHKVGIGALRGIRHYTGEILCHTIKK